MGNIQYQELPPLDPFAEYTNGYPTLQDGDARLTPKKCSNTCAAGDASQSMATSGTRIRPTLISLTAVRMMTKSSKCQR